MTQAEYARHRNVNRSYINRLAKVSERISRPMAWVLIPLMTPRGPDIMCLEFAAPANGRSSATIPCSAIHDARRKLGLFDLQSLIEGRR